MVIHGQPWKLPSSSVAVSSSCVAVPWSAMVIVMVMRGGAMVNHGQPWSSPCVAALQTPERWEGCTLVLAASTVSWKAGEVLSSSVYGDRAHLLCPGREGKLKDRRSTGIYGNQSLKRRVRFGDGGMHPEFSRRKNTGGDARYLPGADASQASRWKMRG